MMQPPGDILVGQRVKVLLGPEFWQDAGWFEGTVIRIDPYSAHRSFYWVELDTEVRFNAGGKARLISVLNPKHIAAI
jgi:hypothetical protein